MYLLALLLMTIHMKNRYSKNSYCKKGGVDVSLEFKTQYLFLLENKL